MCLYPKLIINKKYVANQKNKGIVPICDDERKKYVPVGCGKCMECMRKKSREWSVRLQEEIKENKNGKFVTLTFSNDYINKLTNDILTTGNYYLDSNNLATLAVRRFLGRWRKEYGKSVRHWMVTELGGKRTERIHIHGIIFTDESRSTIERIWKYGHIWTGQYVNEKTINYIVKYMNKIDEKHKNYKSKVFTSAGIGRGFEKSQNFKRAKYSESGTREEYITRTGARIGLPIYYRNKLYSEKEREILWMEKLNKEERWVNGIRIDVSKNMDNYEQAVEWARKVSNSLGYGDDRINWDERQYKLKLKKIKSLKINSK